EGVLAGCGERGVGDDPRVVAAEVPVRRTNLAGVAGDVAAKPSPVVRVSLRRAGMDPTDVQPLRHLDEGPLERQLREQPVVAAGIQRDEPRPTERAGPYDAEDRVDELVGADDVREPLGRIVRD